METKCPICYNPKTESISVRLNLYKCKKCNHTFTNLPKEDEEKYEDNYFIETHKKWFENPDFRLFEKIFSQIRKHITTSKIRLLDVGCGQGSFLKHIHKIDKSMELSGIDFVKNTHPQIRFFSGDFLKMDINDSFNVVTNFMVIEHVDDPHLFTKKMVSSMDKDGLLIVNTINSDSLIYRVARIMNAFGFSTAFDRLYKKHHLQHFTNKSLITLLEMNNLKVFKIKNHNYQLKAVDVPKSSPIVEKLYIISIALMFSISKLLNWGHHQTLYCTKN